MGALYRVGDIVSVKISGGEPDSIAKVWKIKVLGDGSYLLQIFWYYMLGT